MGVKKNRCGNASLKRKQGNKESDNFHLKSEIKNCYSKNMVKSANNITNKKKKHGRKKINSQNPPQMEKVVDEENEYQLIKPMESSDDTAFTLNNIISENLEKNEFQNFFSSDLISEDYSAETTYNFDELFEEIPGNNVKNQTDICNENDTSLEKNFPGAQNFLSEPSNIDNLISSDSIQHDLKENQEKTQEEQNYLFQNQEDIKLKMVELNTCTCKSNDDSISQNSSINDSFIKEKKVTENISCVETMHEDSDLTGSKSSPNVKVDLKSSNKNFDCHVKLDQMAVLNRVIYLESNSNMKYYFCTICEPKRIFLSETALAKHFKFDHSYLFQDIEPAVTPTYKVPQKENVQSSFYEESSSKLISQKQLEIIGLNDDEYNVDVLNCKNDLKSKEQFSESSEDDSDIFNICNDFIQKMKHLPLRMLKSRRESKGKK